MSVTLPVTLFLYADIETLPSQDPAVRAEIDAKHVVGIPDIDAIKPAANLKDPGLIEADITKKRTKAWDDHDAAKVKAAAGAEEEYRRTCLDATTGHIACISMALGDDEVLHAVNVPLHDFADRAVSLDEVRAGERRMLEVFFFELEAMLSQLARNDAEASWDAHEPIQIGPEHWQLNVPGTDGKYGIFAKSREAFIRDRIQPQTPTLVCHHAAFDIRYIWQRAIILGVAVPAWWPIDARPWDTGKVDDTMLAWAGAKGTIGLDRLCRALGIPGKPDSTDGSKVWDAVREGRIDEVCSYCDGDVERLRAVHRRIRGIEQPKAQFVNLQLLGEGWTETERDALFHAASAAANAQHGAAQEGGAS